MARYYVNKNTSNPGNHNEVHKEGCRWLAYVIAKVDLGEHYDCHSAVKKAETYYPNNVDGSNTCCPNCHTF
jgi:hypothetical protein